MKHLRFLRANGYIAILCLLIVGANVSILHAQESTFLHQGMIYSVPVDYLDPAFPAEDARTNNIESPAYISYYQTHYFPLPEEGDYERKLEIWVRNNHYFPQFLPNGNPVQDSTRFSMAVEVWKQKHPEAVKYIVGKVNNTELSDEDFDLLFNSFPRKQHSDDVEMDQRLYEEAVQEWIRVYSFEKYVLIEPYVREAEMLNHNVEEVK